MDRNFSTAWNGMAECERRAAKAQAAYQQRFDAGDAYKAGGGRIVTPKDFSTGVSVIERLSQIL